MGAHRYVAGSWAGTFLPRPELARPRNCLVALLGGALGLTGVPALAQEREPIRLRVGLGAQTIPEFVGAGSNKWAPLWDVAIKRGPGPFDFEAPDDNFDIKLFSTGRFSAGPVANLQGGRKEGAVKAAIGKVSTTFEAGGFVQYEVSQSIRLRAEVRKGIGGHGGLVASLGADHVWREGDRFLVSIGPRLMLSDERYQRAWFGIDAAASTASGLREFRPGGGPFAIAATSGLTYQFSKDVGLFGFARYERLFGDAARSPVVRELGSRNQISAGAGLSYSFSIRR